MSFLNQGVERRACRFKINPTSSGGGGFPRIPTVEFDSTDPHSLPCDRMSGDSIPASAKGLTVPSDGCLRQRQAELCPRGLGVDVSLELTF